MHVLVRDDRRVAVHRTATRAGWLASAGIVDGDVERTIVFCHSAPGAGIFDPDPVETQARDVTLLAVDRPGYGGSDPIPDGEWATVGVGRRRHRLRAGRAPREAGGGRRVVGRRSRCPGARGASAGARRPGRRRGDAGAAGGGAVDLALDTSWRSRPCAGHRRAKSTPLSRNTWPGSCRRIRSRTRRSSSSRRVRRTLMLSEPRRRVRASARCSGSRSCRAPTGLAADIAGYCLQPWGFEPGEVEAKVLLLYGSRDPVAGPKHGRWWKEQLPDSRLEVSPGSGHLLIVPLWHRVLSHLAPGRARATAERDIAAERLGRSRRR